MSKLLLRILLLVSSVGFTEGTTIDKFSSKYRLDKFH
jgi:hypothetical protein